MPASRLAFLTAEWRYLAMLNYEVDPSILTALVPAGTLLDSHNGKTFISIIGFLFLHTRLLGIAIPFHRNFEEVNLRFYVRRKSPDGWRRGVVFIKEIVPRGAIALTARFLYNERYVSLPMSHRIDPDSRGCASSILYSWRHDGFENQLKLRVAGNAQPLRPGSVQEFITEHYWGYSSLRNGSTLEYRVDHPRWDVWETTETSLECNAEPLFGKRFVEVLKGPPSSAFLVEGSHVRVFMGRRLNT
jgi:uncharacterized protein YqjF (DUF2071 family)